MIESHATTQMSVDLRSAGDELFGVRNFCCRFMDAFWVGDDRDERLVPLQLAANEAVANVTEHGYENVPGKLITCTASCHADRIELDILHRGRVFNPPSETPVIDWPLEGGMGLYLIEQSVDEVKYCRTEDGRQCIRLVLYFNHSQG